MIYLGPDIVLWGGLKNNLVVNPFVSRIGDLSYEQLSHQSLWIAHLPLEYKEQCNFVITDDSALKGFISQPFLIRPAPKSAFWLIRLYWQKDTFSQGYHFFLIL